MMDEELQLEKKLDYLRREHRDLDEAIRELERDAMNVFIVRQKKKEKLQLKEKIADIERTLYPDIIA